MEVSAGFDLSSVQNDQVIRSANHFHIVTDHNDGFSCHKIHQRFHDFVLADHIDTGSGLVHNQNLGSLQNHAGDGNTLHFAAGVLVVKTADLGVKTVLFFLNEIAGLGFLCRIYQFFLSKRPVDTVGDVLADGALNDLIALDR